jgi:transposase
MTQSASEDKMIIGVDVSKDWLDIAVSGGAVARLGNDPGSIAAWLERQAGIDLLAFEPTGGYERALSAALSAARIAHVRVHPNDVLAYRKSRGIKAKTDRLDARLIASFAAEELTRRDRLPADLGDPALRELAARRRQVVAILHGERCRLDLAADPDVRASLLTISDSLQDTLANLEAKLQGRIAQDPQTSRLATLLQSFKGVGPITATTLIADLPELGRLSAKQIAALVGLAPQTRQSGKARYHARTPHGRPGVRRVLFNAARSAIQHNPIMRDFYQRLVNSNGRPGKVALTATMRKILVTLNAIARDQQPWKHLLP